MNNFTKYSIQGQRGAVLIMSLMLMALLVILTLTSSQVVVGGTFMTGNFKDRESAFQVAELGLDQGIQAISGLSGIAADEEGNVLNCMDASNVCMAEPADAGVHDSAANLDVAWAEIDNAIALPATAVGRPQYFIERVGESIDSSVQTGGRNSTSFEYGEEVSGSVNYVFYRVTARNFNPGNDSADGRALVKLQAIVRRPF